MPLHSCLSAGCLSAWLVGTCSHQAAHSLLLGTLEPLWRILLEPCMVLCGDKVAALLALEERLSPRVTARPLLAGCPRKTRTPAGPRGPLPVASPGVAAEQRKCPVIYTTSITPQEGSGAWHVRAPEGAVPREGVAQRQARSRPGPRTKEAEWKGGAGTRGAAAGMDLGRVGVGFANLSGLSSDGRNKTKTSDNSHPGPSVDRCGRMVGGGGAPRRGNRMGSLQREQDGAPRGKKGCPQKEQDGIPTEGRRGALQLEQDGVPAEAHTLWRVSGAPRPSGSALRHADPAEGGCNLLGLSPQVFWL